MATDEISRCFELPVASDDGFFATPLREMYPAIRNLSNLRFYGAQWHHRDFETTVGSDCNDIVLLIRWHLLYV